jgi:hypothetical protein
MEDHKTEERKNFLKRKTVIQDYQLVDPKFRNSHLTDIVSL